ncbi:MAG: winged helix-turn-helix transcriptional regulator [Candidatus Omnitrophota bacterium]
MEDDRISQNQLAKKLGISRVRVNQILNLLKLPKEKQDYILKHGKDEMVTERKLRKILADKNL